MDEREYVYKMCECKIRYKKIKNAENALRSLKKTGKIIPSNFLPYSCIYCGGYHLGHHKNDDQ